MHLLSQTSNPSLQESVVRDIANDIMLQFEEWFSFSTSEEDQDEDLVDSLIPILHDIIDISHIIRGQRAAWTVHHSGVAHSQADRTQPLYLREGEMAIEPQPGNTRKKKKGVDGAPGAAVGNTNVKFILFPALWKRGNTDGRGYDVKSLMIKEVVICKYQCQ